VCLARVRTKIDLRVASVSFSRNGLLAMGGFDGVITLLNVHTGQILSQTPAYKGIIHRICFSPDADCLLTTGSCGESRFEPQNRDSDLKCFELPFEFSFKHTLSKVAEALVPHLPHDGLHEIIADYAW